MTDQNPYAAPTSNLANGPIHKEQVHQPTTVPPGRGWRWIADGFEYFKQAPGTWIGIIVVWNVIFIALTCIPINWLLSIVLSTVVSEILNPVFVGGVMLGCRAIDDKQALRIDHLFSGFNTRLGPLLAVSGLCLAATLGILLIVVALVAMLGGIGILTSWGHQEDLMVSGLGIVVILLPVSVGTVLFTLVLMAFWFAPALIVNHELSAFEAMRLSFVGCVRNAMPFLVYGLCAMGLSLLAIIPFLLGLLVLSPVLIASIYVGYKDIYLGE